MQKIGIERLVLFERLLNRKLLREFLRTRPEVDAKALVFQNLTDPFSHSPHVAGRTERPLSALDDHNMPTIASAAPPTRVATIGIRLALASRMAQGNPSH